MEVPTMETNVSTPSHIMQDSTLLLDSLPLQVTEFIAAARTSQERLLEREKLLEQKLTASENFIEEELSKIQGVIGHFQDILKNAGAADWRMMAEAIHKEGQQQAHTLHNVLSDIKKSLKDSCAHLDTSSTQIVKGLQKSLNNLHTSELEQLAEDSGQEVKAVANSAIKEMAEIGRWFHWKNIVMVFALSLIVVLFTDLFIDDEWPWESHKTAVKERLAGQAVIGAWPRLSLTDQQKIMNNFA